MTDAITLQSKLDAQADIIRAQEAEIAQLSRGLRITREQLEDAMIELDGLRRAPTIPAPPLYTESCLPAVERRGERGT